MTRNRIDALRTTGHCKTVAQELAHEFATQHRRIQTQPGQDGRAALLGCLHPLPGTTAGPSIQQFQVVSIWHWQKIPLVTGTLADSLAHGPIRVGRLVDRQRRRKTMRVLGRPTNGVFIDVSRSRSVHPAATLAESYSSVSILR